MKPISPRAARRRSRLTSRLVGLILLATCAPLPGVRAGDGSLADPYTNGEVDDTTLDAGGTYNRIDTGTAPNFTSGDTTSLGGTTAANHLTVTNGATFNIGTFYTGTGADADNNALTITSGAAFNTSGYFTFGGAGSGNTLTVDGGATLSIGNVFQIGTTGGSNTVTLSGSGTQLNSTARIDFGGGNLNTLTVSAGAAVASGEMRLGYGGSYNTVTVTGTDTQWSINGQLSVSTYGTDNTFNLSAGATVSATDIQIGSAASNANGARSDLNVSGNGSSLITSGPLRIGRNTADIHLTISDGGLVRLGDAVSDALTISNGGLLRFDDGVFALYGDRTTALDAYLAAGYLQTWDSGESAWTTLLAGDLTATFYADNSSAMAATARGAFTGYDNLGGYTLFTVTAVPEPAATAALISLAAAALGVARRRRPRGPAA